MSHDLYNPYSPESQDSPQRPYQPPNVGPGNVGEPPHMVPGSTHASYGGYFGTSMNPSHIYPSMHPGSMGYIRDQNKPTTELESSIDVHIKRARQEVGLQSILKKPVPDWNTDTTAWPQGSSDLGPTGYRSSPPISDGQFSRYSRTMPSGAPSWHWPSGQQTSNYHSTSSSPSATNVPTSHYSQSSERYPVSHYSSGDEYVSSNRPSTAAADSAPSPRVSMAYEHPSTSREADNNQTRFTSESAMDILKRFDLQEEDLEELCAYPEEQLSPANLPYLLRDIRQKKAKNSSAASQSSTGHQAQGSQCAPETRVASGAEVKREAQAPPTFQQPSKVIEYGHTSKYTLGFREEEKDGGHTSTSYMSQMRDTQPKDAAPAKPGVPVFSNGSQRSNISSPVYSPLPSVKASLSKKPAAHSIQTAIASPTKELIALQPAASVAKPTATNIIPKRDSGADRVASSGCQRAAPGPRSTSHSPAPGVGTTIQKPAPGIGTFSHKPAPGPGTTSQRPAPGPVPIPMNQGPPSASDVSIQRPPPAKPAGNRVPTAALISDYMGVTPDLFPHTCSLCNKPCVGMKDWLDHRNHIVHLAGCRLLRRQYSEWEPDTVSLDSAPEESQQPPTTTTVPASSQSSWPSLQATSHGGPAPSTSAPPLPRRTSEAHQESWSSQRKRSRSKSSGRKGSRSPRRKRSRSPQTKRSRSPQTKRSRSKSSGRRRSSSRKRSPSSASLRSPDWKRTSGRASSPLSSRPVHSRRCRSRSSSSSSPSSDRYRGKGLSSPARRSRRRSGSPRRGRGSPRDARGTRPTRRSRSGSRSPQRRRSRSHDRRSSGHRQEETSIEQLAKKLLESSGVQSSTGSTSLELVVQSLAPVLAELAKLKAASSSSSASSKDQKKPSSSSSSRDEQKQSSSSSRDEKKPSSSSSSSRDEQKQSSSSSRDEKKPSSSSSSSRDEQKQSSSSSRDERKPSSSSSSRDEQKQASTSSTKGGKDPPSSSSSVKGIRKVLLKSPQLPAKSAKPQGSGLLGFVPAHPPLLLSGLPSTVTQQQVFSAVEKFGKSRLISVAQQRQEATVFFLQAAAAHALLGFTELKIGGNPITVTQKVVPVQQLTSIKPGPAVKVQSSATMATKVVAEAPSSSVQCNKPIAPGNKTNTPGTKGTTPGNKKAPPGNKKATPGNATTIPGNKTTMHANTTPTPSKSTTMPDNKVTTRGNNTATPDKNTAPPGTAPIMPGNKTTTPGNTTATPVKKTTMPGNATTLPDNKTTTPGNKTAILCKKTAMPSNTKTVPGSTTTPGNKMTTPGNKTATPGNKAATPVNKTTTPGNKVVTPGNKAATPGNKTTTPGNKAATPVNKTATPGNKTATPSNKTTTPGNKTATPGSTTIIPDNKMTPPGNKAGTPGNKAGTPGNKAATPGNKTATPSNKTTTPGNKTATPSNKTTTPGNKAVTPVNKTATPGNKTATPGNKTATPGNKTATPGSTTNMPIKKKITPGNTVTTPVNKTTTPGNKMAPPVNVTITPGNKTTTPGSDMTTPGSDTTTTSNMTPRPDNKAIAISNNTDMQGDTRTMPVQPVAPSPPVAKVFPTVLFLKSIQCLDVRCWTWNDFLPYATSGATIMVTDLPEKGNEAYTESSMKQVLMKFASLKLDKCYILPDNCTAFVAMTVDRLAPMMEALVKGALLNFGTVRCHLLKENALEFPITFYQHLLSWSEKLYDETTLAYRLVYISNIPTYFDFWMEAFHEGITKTGGVRLYLPLMGKIFVEFVTVEDADRFGVWLSDFRASKCRQIRVTRPGLVQCTDGLAPVRPRAQALFKPGYESVFWMAMKALPGFYPTLSPQFYIPAHRTVNGPEDLEWAETYLTGQSVVMVTGLSFRWCRHRDLVNKVWPYFVEKDISRVFYSVVILPLQRRAFIHFDDGVKCKEFVSDFLQKPFTIRGCHLTLHFLLDHLEPCTTELQLYNRLLQWSNVVPEETVHQDQLLLVERDYCNMKELKYTFNFLECRVGPWVSCLVLANRVVFQLPRDKLNKSCMTKLLDKLNSKRKQMQIRPGRKIPRAIRKEWKSENNFTSNMHKVKFWFDSPQHAEPGQSPPDPPAPCTSAPGPSGPAPPTPVAPAELCASALDPAGPLGSGPRPPALSQEMYRFFATAIHQHRQARVGQEVSRGGQEGSQKEQVSMELDKTASPSTSSGLESNSSTTAHSSSLSGATVSSSSRLPKSSSSSSSSFPPPAGVVPSSSSELNTQQKKCGGSPPRVSEADDTTRPSSPTSREGTRITTKEMVEPLPACTPITTKGVLSEAAMVCEGDMARPGHMMAAETSAVKSAASLTGKDALHTDPALEEEGKRKAQQELTLPGKDVVVSPSEDAKETRVEVDETHRQMGDEKTSDHMLHSRPECGEETPHQTLVRPEAPGLPDPESQTSEPQEEEMLAKVADEAEPFQEPPEHKETVLEEGKMTTVEEQMPSANDETPTVVSEAADALLRGASTEEGDTHQHMDCVEGSPPKEASNEEPTEEEQNTEKPTEEEQKTKEPTEEEQKTKEPTVEEQKTKEEQNTEELKTKEPTVEEQKTKEPTVEEQKTEEQKTKEPTVEEQNTEKPTVEEQNTEKPTVEEQKTKEPAVEEQKTKEPAVEEQKTKEELNTNEQNNKEDQRSKELCDKEAQSTKEPTEKEQRNKEEKNSKDPTEEENKNKEATEEGLKDKEPTEEEQSNEAPTDGEDPDKRPAVEEVAPEMEQRRSKRGHYSPASKPLATKPLASKPLATKPLASKPLATKQLETKPLATKQLATKQLETKQLETKQLETKQLETKQLETKPLATKPLATKPLATKALATKALATKALATKPLVTKPLSTRRSARHSTPTMKRESPAEDPVEVEKAVSVEVDAASPEGGESPPSGAAVPKGQPHPKEEEVEYQVTDSVEGELVEVKGVQLPTRGKRGRPPKPTAKNVRVKKEQPTAPVPEESGKKPEEPLEDQAGPTRTETKQQEAPEEKSTGKEDGAEETQTADKAAPSDAKPRVSGEGVSLEEVATYQVLDSVEDEEPEVKEVPPVTRGTRGRGRKAKTPTKKDCKPSVEETVFEVLDSIGGDVAEEAPAPEQPGRPRRGPAAKEPTPEKDGKIQPDDTPEGPHGQQEQVKKEEEVARPVADSAKQEPQGDKQPAAGKRRSGRGRKEEVPVSGTSKVAAKEGQQRAMDLQEDEVYQVVDSIEDDPREEEPVDSPGPRRRSQRRDPAPAKSRATRATPARAAQGEEPLYQVVDSVGGEEEPAPPPEEPPPGLEPPRGKRGRKVAGSDSATEAAAAKKMRTARPTAPPTANEGVGAKKATDAREKQSPEQAENALVSLDEVSEEEEDYPDDSVEEEELRKRQAVEERRREEEEEERKPGAGMEGLVTLDEVGEDELGEVEVEEEEVGRGGEEESGRTEGGITEEELQALVTLDEIVEEEQEGEEPTHSAPLPDDQSEAGLNTETVCDEEKASSSIVGECKQNEEQAEECVSFVTLDEVGYEEEEETQTRSKRERKCTSREQQQQQQQQQQQPATAKPSGQESPPIPAHATSLLACEPGAVLSVKGAEPMAESPAGDGEETGSEEQRLGRKASSKARREEEGAEPKRVRSRSPSVANDYTLPPFTPCNPLGTEHVVPGFYCNLCCVFYKDESRARTLHCSGLGHYQNLKKYYQGLQREQSRSQSGGSAPGNAPRRL